MTRPMPDLPASLSVPAVRGGGSQESVRSGIETRSDSDALLARINSPADLKTLSLKQLEQLAGELRQYVVEVVSRTGGISRPVSARSS